MTCSAAAFTGPIYKHTSGPVLVFPSSHVGGGGSGEENDLTTSSHDRGGQKIREAGAAVCTLRANNSFNKG